MNCLFNVTINNISVIYVTAHRCAGGLKNKLDIRSGSQPHRNFVGFFKLPVPSTDTGPPFSYGYSEKPPDLVTFYDTLGIRRIHCRLNARVSHGSGSPWGNITSLRGRNISPGGLSRECLHLEENSFWKVQFLGPVLHQDFPIWHNCKEGSILC